MTTLKYLLCFCLLSTAKLYACCVEESHTLTELILHDSYNRSIFMGRVVHSGAGFDGEYFAIIEIDTIYKGIIGSKQVRVWTGGNTSAGGEFLVPGMECIIFAHKSSRQNEYSAFVCDQFSAQKDTKWHRNQRYEAVMQTLRHYKKLRDTQYTGKVEWYDQEGQKAASGQMENGLASGPWQHFTPKGKQSTSAHYQKGLLHGLIEHFLPHFNVYERNYYENGIKKEVKADFSDSEQGRLGPISEQIGTLDSIPIVRKLYRHWTLKGNVRVDATVLSPNPQQQIRGYFEEVLHGLYSQYDTNGVVVAKGRYYRGAKVGDWIEKGNLANLKTYQMPARPNTPYYAFHENGTVAVTGQLINGLADGMWLSYDEKGNCNSEVHFLAGKKHGQEFRYHNDFSYLSTTFVHGLEHGMHIERYNTDTISFQQSFQLGQPHGLAIRWHPNGQKQSVGIYVNGSLEGTYIEMSAKGDTTMQCQVLNGVLHGEAIEQYQLLSGQCRRKTGNYTYGLKSGRWVTSDCDGNLLRVCEYKDYTGNRENRVWQRYFYDD